MTDLFAWNEDAAGEDDVFFASTSRSIDDGGFHLTIQTDPIDDLADWDEGNFASYETFEHLLSTDVEADGDYAHFLQAQTYDIDNLLSPPSKPSTQKKRVSPAKDIQHKRAKQSEGPGSWKNRPDHMQVLGTSIGSPSSSLGVGLPVGFVGGDHLVSPSTTLGVMTDLGMDASMSLFGPDYMDQTPLTSTPNVTPSRPNVRKSTSTTSSSSNSASKKASPDWTDEEIRLFEEGLVLFGSPSWRQISAFIGSRSFSQVKQFSVKYFSIHGPNVVPHVDSTRMEELRQQYQPTTNTATSNSNSSSGNLSKSGRLKRSPMSPPPADKKLSTPKKTSPGLSSSQSFSSPPGKTLGGVALSSSTSSMNAPNKGPGSRSSSSLSGRGSGSRNKADEQLIVLKKNTDEDDDICIEDDDIDIDGDGDGNANAIGNAHAADEDDEDDDDQAFLRSVVADEEEDGISMDEDEVESSHPSPSSQSQHSQTTASTAATHTHYGHNHYTTTTTTTTTTATSSVSATPSSRTFQSLQQQHLQSNYMDVSDNLGPVKGSSAPNSVAGKSMTPQWRQRASNSFSLDESGDMMMREDSIGFSDADSSIAGSETMSLHESCTSIYPDSSSHASAVSIAQALKALGLEGEAWIEDVEIPPPKVLELQEDHVLDLEMLANSEFFEGNAVKTPERYVRIRNHIVRTWSMNKQRYITKTSVRRGLRDCGDVNAIGRVHQFLELVGAINFGLEAPPSCRKQGQPEPLSVLMMNKAPLQLHLQQQQATRLMRANSSPNNTVVVAPPTPSMVPGAPSYASVASGSTTPVPVIGHGRPTIRSQFDASYEVVKNHPSALPTLMCSSNIMLVIDLHAHIHKRDGFGLIAGHYNATNFSVHLKYAMPYTGPQSHNNVPLSLQGVAAWEKSVAAWIEQSSVAKHHSALGTPLEVLGYYTTHKANDMLSCTQFTHYKNVFCKGAARNKPFIGIFAVPFERTPDSTLFTSVMFPIGVNTSGLSTGALGPNGAPKKTLCLLKRNVVCERKLPQEQFAQLFSAYVDNEVALNLTERDDRDPHRTLLDRCLVSLSSAVFVSERDKNAFWEHLRVLANEGVNPKLQSLMNTKDAIWSFKEPSTPFLGSDLHNHTQQHHHHHHQEHHHHQHPNGVMPSPMMPNASVSSPLGNLVISHPLVGGNGPNDLMHLNDPLLNAYAPPALSHLHHHTTQPLHSLNDLHFGLHDAFGHTAQKLDFSSIALAQPHQADPLSSLDVGSGLLDHHMDGPRF
jgi:hypothetical protein